MVLTEAALHEMVATFKGPMSVTRDMALMYEVTANAFTPLCIERVEVRRDEQGAYLAGLVVSRPLSPAFIPTWRNFATGETHARLVGVAFVHEAVSEGPVELTDDGDKPIPGTLGHEVLAEGVAMPSSASRRTILLG